jgi:hypothetical protein
MLFNSIGFRRISLMKGDSMITDITRWGAFKPLLCAFFVLGLSGVLLAQVAPHAGGAAERDILRVRRFPKPSKALLLRTPEYNTSVARSGGSRRPREWMVHETNYETRPEWIDSLDFSYTVLRVWYCRRRQLPDSGK